MEYKSSCKKANSAVSKAKLKKNNKFYDKLGTKEGDKEIYEMVKVREKRSEND